LTASKEEVVRSIIERTACRKLHMKEKTRGGIHAWAQASTYCIANFSPSVYCIPRFIYL